MEETKPSICQLKFHILSGMFLEDYKDRNKKFNEWTKVAETLQIEIPQVTVAFSGLQRTRNSSIRKHYERHIGIFFLILKNVFPCCMLKFMTYVLILCIRL